MIVGDEDEFPLLVRAAMAPVPNNRIVVLGAGASEVENGVCGAGVDENVEFALAFRVSCVW